MPGQAGRRRALPPLRRIVVDLDDSTFASPCDAAARQGCELGDLVARAVADGISSIIGNEVA